MCRFRETSVIQKPALLPQQLAGIGAAAPRVPADRTLPTAVADDVDGTLDMLALLTGPWRYVPDVTNAHLEGDQGTAAELLRSRPKPAATEPPEPARSPQPTSAQAPAGSAHSTLPAPRPFFGRGEPLEPITRYLPPEDHSWGAVLDGPGGVGKTALALEMAHRAPVEHFPLKLFAVYTRVFSIIGILEYQNASASTSNNA